MAAAARVVELWSWRCVSRVSCIAESGLPVNEGRPRLHDEPEKMSRSRRDVEVKRNDAWSR